jgi:hypothetical protein
LGDFLKKIAPKSFCDIFKKKCAQRQKMRPTAKNIAQMAKFRPIWSHFTKIQFVSKLAARVARFFFKQNTKTGKIYQITTNYTKCP